MVAAGLGVTVLPSYSVIGDPLQERGAVTFRKIEGDDTSVRLVVQRRRSGSPTLATRDLHGLFVEEATVYAATAAEALPPPATKRAVRARAKRAIPAPSAHA
jgi:hypothetical protein